MQRRTMGRLRPLTSEDREQRAARNERRGRVAKEGSGPLIRTQIKPTAQPLGVVESLTTSRLVRSFMPSRKRRK